MSLEAMMKRRNSAVDKMTAILATAKEEERDLSADERKDYDAAMKEANDLNADIERVKAHEKMQAELAKVEPAAASRQSADAFPGGVPDAKTKFENFGEFLNAAVSNPNDQRLNYQDGLKGEGRMDTGEAGGFAVPKEYLSEVRQFQSQESIIRGMATVLPAGNAPDAELEIPSLNQKAGSNMFGGITVHWTGEGDIPPASNMKINMLTLKPNELLGRAILTNKLLRNWAVSSALLEKQFFDALAATEDFAFMNADGVSKPLGILKSKGCIKVERASAGTVTYADLVNMLAAHKGKGTFVVSRGTLPTLMKLKDDEGKYIWVTSARDGEPNTLLGRPVIFSERNPALGLHGDVVLGDFSQYLIKEGAAPLVSASEHQLFDANKTVVKIVSSVDGQPSLNGPIVGEDNVNYSPFVSLDIFQA